MRFQFKGYSSQFQVTSDISPSASPVAEVFVSIFFSGYADIELGEAIRVGVSETL